MRHLNRIALERSEMSQVSAKRIMIGIYFGCFILILFMVAH